MMINNHRRKTCLEDKETLHVPHELKIEIQPSFLVKSLLGFKCVCKFWLSLIFDFHFANYSYFHFGAATHTRRIVFMSNSLSNTISIDFESSIDDDIAIEKLNHSFTILNLTVSLKL